MKSLTSPQQKILKVVHLLAAAIWLTCVMLLGLLPRLVDGHASDDSIRLFLRLYHFIDMQMLTPAAIMTLLTGLLYSLFTHWGFFKHGWLALKWAITLFIVLWGTFHLGPSVKALLAWTTQGHVHMAQDAYYLDSMALGTWAAIINTTLLVLAVVVSVFKPWKRAGKP